MDVLEFSPDGRELAVCASAEAPRIEIWDVASGERQHVLLSHADTGTSLVYSASGRLLASGTSQGEVKVWTLPPEALPVEQAAQRPGSATSGRWSA